MDLLKDYLDFILVLGHVLLNTYSLYLTPSLELYSIVISRGLNLGGVGFRIVCLLS